MKKILITGGTGMVGQAVIRLYHRQYEIHFIGRNKILGCDIAKKYGATFHQIELSDINGLMSVCKNMDIVVHCAALSSPWGKPEDFDRANVQGTCNILAAASHAGVKKFVHISTPSIYFDFKSKTAIQESSELPLSFCNEYASSKAEAEQLVLRSELNSIILRPRGIFGPQDKAIAPRLLKRIKNSILLLPSNRNPVVDLTYVDNVADAIVLSVESNCNKGEIFNVTNDQPEHIITLLDMLLGQLVPNTKIKGLNYSWVKLCVSVNQWVHKNLLNYKEPRLTDYSAALLHYDQTLNIDKAKRILGYKPKITIAEGIHRYAIWHKNPTV